MLAHGVEPVETAARGARWGRVRRLAPLLAGGFALGLMSLVYYDRWLKSKRATPLVGPGAAAVDEFELRSWIERLTPGRRLALLIATGIGLHNFGEGLAIGQSAAAGEVSLALVLIIGFGLHNATEGFGIVGPMSGEAELPSWGFLGLMGLIGGGPTFLGTLIGQAWVSPALEIVFFAVAARLDPLRRDPALRRLQALRDAEARQLDAPRSGSSSASRTDWVLVAAGQPDRL